MIVYELIVCVDIVVMLMLYQVIFDDAKPSRGKDVTLVIERKGPLHSRTLNHLEPED
jgi:hypothetical protein